MQTFLIRIGDPVGEAYPVEVCLDDGADAGWQERPRARGTVPADQLHGRYPSLVDDSVDAAAIAAAGRHLFDLLSSGRLAAAWQAVGDRPCRVVLDVRPPALRRVPWELLCTPRRRWLFSDRGRPGMRARLPFRVALSALRVPVRLLVIVGDPRDRALRAEDEIDGIYAGLSGVPCSWQVDVLQGPRIEELRSSFADIAPHVLHFIGHGTEQLGEPALEVIDPSGQDWPLTAEVITNALRGAPAPRLAVLNACRTGDAGSQELLWGVTDGFLEIGTAAVVSMQGEIAADPAVRFGTELYRRLAGGEPVDMAVAGARSEIQWASGFHPRDWALPTLTVQAAPDPVLKVSSSVDPDAVLRRHGTLFEDVRWLVDRSKERRAVWGRVDPENGDAIGDTDLLFVTGIAAVGKSALMRSCLLTSHMRGLGIVYVELPQSRNLEWSKLLELVAKTAVTWLGDDVRPLADGFLSEARKTAAQLLPAGLVGVPAPAPALSLPVRLDRPMQPDDYRTAVFDRFRSFLKELAGGKPLLLVLDRIGGVQQFGDVVEGLLRPAADQHLRPVRLVIVDQQHDIERQVPRDLRIGRELPIPPFRKSEAVRLAREYLVRKRGEYEVMAPDPELWRLFVAWIRRWAEERASMPRDEVLPSELGLAELLARNSTGLGLP